MWLTTLAFHSGRSVAPSQPELPNCLLTMAFARFSTSRQCSVVKSERGFGPLSAPLLPCTLEEVSNVSAPCQGR